MNFAEITSLTSSGPDEGGAPQATHSWPCQPQHAPASTARSPAKNGALPDQRREDLSMSKILLTVPEAAAALAISRSKLYELLATGVVRSVRIDGSRRVPVEALEAYVAGLLSEEAPADATAS
jgi:excisionase family DNA binding protein